MKKYLLLAGLLTSFTTFAQSGNVAMLKKTLKPMQPLSVEEKQGVATVALDTATITPEIYDTAIFSICMPVWTEKENKTFLKNTKEIHILNKFSFAGYILSNPRETCDKAGEQQPEQSKITILSQTRVALGK
ncbi:hypothetical protein C3D70_12970 [Cronobacter sakazakii]|uniref:hypothetical protein n=1 Tax=Cronobacter sakazakii TaxID=28141 RepID=UPI000CF1383D|nr:hypothetical protein [Cronobacter sakazakii]PPX83806.1 hypothetical protein C3D70_12970 [Cronobacter sakazakii]